MDILIEIIVYFLVILGLITVCFIFFEKANFINTYSYIQKCDSNYFKREKVENENVTVTLNLSNISSETKSRIIQSIEHGEYYNIYDIIDNFNVIEE